MTEFQVNDMTCGHCADRITRTIQAADAAARVDIELPRHRVRVESTLDPEGIAAVIRQAGYTPEAVEAV